MKLNDNPKFLALSPLKQKIILEIQQQSMSKSIEQMLPQIMMINKELNRRNMSFTKQESELLISAMEEAMTPEERKKFEMIKAML